MSVINKINKIGNIWSCRVSVKKRERERERDSLA